MKTIVSVSPEPRRRSRSISRGNLGKSRSIKSIRLTAFLKHFLCSFILDLGVIMSGSFSQGLWQNKKTFHPKSLLWKHFFDHVFIVYFGQYRGHPGWLYHWQQVSSWCLISDTPSPASDHGEQGDNYQGHPDLPESPDQELISCLWASTY